MSPIVVGLGALAVAAAAISALTGVAGGVLLLSGLLLVMPATAVVPLHAAAQLTANASRLIAFRGFGRRDIVVPMIVALVPGTLLGAWVLHWVVSIDSSWLKILIAVGIVASLFARRPTTAGAARPARGLIAATGLLCGTLGVLAGSTGPIVSQLLLHFGVVKEDHIASKAYIQAAHNVMKLPVFGIAIAFDYGAHALELSWLCGGVMLGTAVGKRLLSRLNSGSFTWLARAMLLVVAATILVEQTSRWIR